MIFINFRSINLKQRRFSEKTKIRGVVSNNWKIEKEF